MMSSHSDPGAASLAADLWPPEAIEAVRGASLELRARAGVRVGSPRATELLVAAGCAPGPQGRDLMPAGVVADASASCPASPRLLARDQVLDIGVSPTPGRIYVHNMGEAPDVADPRSGEAPRRRARRDLRRLPDEAEAELCRLIDAAAARLGVAGHPDPRRLLEEARRAA